MITVVVGKEIEKIKGDFESYLNGLNMVGEISYSQYSKLYDEGTKQIQRAYELGKSELEEENAELKEVHESDKRSLALIAKKGADLEKENADLREELTETKRLLARWIDDRPYTVSEQKDLIADTEQYLNEE